MCLYFMFWNKKSQELLLTKILYEFLMYLKIKNYVKSTAPQST